MMNVFVAGHNGMVGSAICRNLSQSGEVNLITKSRDELDLRIQSKVREFFEKNKIDSVYLSAAKVGGIVANNNFSADFISENLIIQSNVIEASFLTGVEKLLFFGSSCIYPKNAPQPMPENALLTGELEKTNEGYAIAKIAGLKMCEKYSQQYGVDFRAIMPTNLYGPRDNFDLETSHVVPALIRRFHEAKSSLSPKVTLWGTGTPMREFLHVDDLAAGAVHVMDLEKSKYQQIYRKGISHINIGSGKEISIKNLAELVAKVVGYRGTIGWDHSRPDGVMRKLTDIRLINQLGWRCETNLFDGLSTTYDWFLRNTRFNQI